VNVVGVAMITTEISGHSGGKSWFRDTGKKFGTSLRDSGTFGNYVHTSLIQYVNLIILSPVLTCYLVLNVVVYCSMSTGHESVDWWLACTIDTCGLSEGSMHLNHPQIAICYFKDHSSVEKFIYTRIMLGIMLCYLSEQANNGCTCTS